MRDFVLRHSLQVWHDNGASGPCATLPVLHPPASPLLSLTCSSKVIVYIIMHRLYYAIVL